jgi:hypothetical protein
MAKATKTFPKYEVTLVLTQEEAETLEAITRSIGGSPKGPRGHMDNIGRALQAAGVTGALELDDSLHI